MQQYGVVYNIGIETNVEGAFNSINQKVMQVGAQLNSFQRIAQTAFSWNQITQSLDSFKQSLQQVIAPGISLDTSMHDLSAITGVTGEKLKEIETNARATARAFGIDASGAAESYKLLLSQLSPDIAQNSEALKTMGEHVAILSKTMGGDAVSATQVLTTAMNQYGVDLSDPIAASKTMSDMMNIMAAAAKEGSAELPQIKMALEQAGMMASSAGVSFEELNAAVQVLDKAGKKGAEGGVAIRNVLAELSMGRYQTKEVKTALTAYGISVEALGDKHLSMADKLRMLQPLQRDTALLTKMFGKENEASALALIQGVDAMETYRHKITGTNTAYEQAQVVMDGYQERMNRISAKLNDLKIGFFNATHAMLPYVQTMMEGVVQTGHFAGGINSMMQLVGSDLFKKLKGINLSGLFTGIQTGMTSLFTFTQIGIKGIGVTIMNIPIIGWIAAAIAAIVALGVYLWDTWKPFRASLFGILEVTKAVFHNIGLVISRIWDNVIKPIFLLIGKVFTTVWAAIWDVVTYVFNAIVTGVIKLYDVIVNTFQAIWQGIKSVFERIVAGASWVWHGIATVFSGVGDFAKQWIIKPIRDAFVWIWDFVSGIFKKLWEQIASFFKPIINLWNKLFSKDGIKDFKGSFEIGYKKGEADFDKSNAGQTDPGKVAAFGLQGNDSTANKKTLANLSQHLPALASAEKGAGGSIKHISIRMDNLIKEFKIVAQHNVAETKEQVQKLVTEALLGAVNDVNLVGN